jgi:hypothetical protein
VILIHQHLLLQWDQYLQSFQVKSVLLLHLLRSIPDLHHQQEHHLQDFLVME